MSDRRFMATWVVAFLGFPLGGLLAIEVAGPIADVPSALWAGVLAGTVIGGAQALALWRRLAVGWRWALAWVGATAVGLAVGNAAAVAITNGGTAVGDLVVMGIAAGLAIGAGQWPLLRRRALALAGLWVPVLTAAWPTGWMVTWAAGVDVERQYAVFGATGALTFAVLTGLALVLVTRRAVPVPRAASFG